MLQVTMAGLRAHAVRFLLTGLVVALSVGFTAGTLVLADSLDRVGVDEVAATARGVDLSVSHDAEPSTETSSDAGADVAAIDATLAGILAVDGVSHAVPRAEAGARGSDADGRIDEGVWLTVTAVPAEGPASGVTLTEGRLPRRTDEAVLDAITAERAGAGVGGTYTMAAWDADPTTFTIVGIVRPPTTGGPTIGTTIDTAVAFGADTTRVDVILDPDADPATVASALETVTGESVETGAQLTERLVSASPSLANALRVPLLILGAVALVVAAFVIANTFRILVAQRTSDLALLRTIGATRRQVRRGVLTESLVVGVVGSLVGLAVGTGGSAAIGGLISSGAPLPVVVSTTTVIASLVIGVAVTVGAAWVPARAATRVAPLAALRTAPDGADDARTGRLRIGLGVLLVAGGAGILAMTATFAADLAGQGIVVVVFGATVFGVGVLVLGPVIMPPLVGAGGRLARAVAGRRGRATLDLATANALRQPRRVAATSGALLIGVTVVAGFAVMATSARSSANAWADDSLPADITVSRASASSPDSEFIPDRVVTAVQDAADVGVVVPVRSTYALAPGLYGESVEVNGVDGALLAELTEIDVAAPGDGEALLDVWTADASEVEVGDVVTFQDAAGEGHEVVIVGISDRLGAGLTVAMDAFMVAFPEIGVTSISVDAVDGADVETVRTGIVTATAGETGIAVRNAADVRSDAMAQFDRAIAVVLAVLGLAVVIAVIGIGNTMSLAVHERTREIGLLRALGQTRRQTRAMLGAEAVVVSGLAGALGVVIAVAFSWVAVRTLPDLSMTVPWLALGGVVVVAGALGWLASLLPARRAARISPVVALATD